MNSILKKSLSSEYVRLARKAAYWQKDYDEWKKHGALCPDLNIAEIINDKIIQDYMDLGWNKITDIYKDQVSNKGLVSKSMIKHIEKKNTFKFFPIEEQELILEILGSIRKYMVKTIFSCIEKSINNDNLNEILTVGSKNITSDFDVSIIGPNANEIMWKMFMTFLAKYSDALPEAFDTNLYSSPIYMYYSERQQKEIVTKSSNLLPQIIKYNKKFFTLMPYTDDDFEKELSWACIKIINSNYQFPKPLNKFIKEATKYKKAMDQIENQINDNLVFKELSLQNNLHPANSINNDTRNIIKRYYLQYLWQESIQKYMYSNDKDVINFIREPIILSGNNIPETNLFFYSNIPNYFSSDAYYTSSSVNAIVIENQSNIKLNYKYHSEKRINGMYLIAVIENLGDLINHITNSDQNIKIVLIKYSKYLYRIYHTLSKIDDKFQSKAENIYRNVLTFRNNYNIKRAIELDIFSYLDYDSSINETKEVYVNKIFKIIINQINKLLINLI